MATMFEGDRDAVIGRLKRMPVKEFLEKLLDDDVVNEIVSSGTVLVIEWTSAVRRPCKMICFGIVRDSQAKKSFLLVQIVASK